MNEIHIEGILKKYNLTLRDSTMPTTDPQGEDSLRTTPVPTEHGQEIFADNLGAAGAEKPL